MEDRIRDLMADVLDLDAASISGETTLENTASWDSIAHLNLCLAIEQEFGLAFQVEEMETMVSFDQIVRVVRAKA